VSVRFDLNAVNSLFGRFFSAGFYYKTFMKPGRGTKAWMFYEKIIRRAAGMGEASREPDPDSYEMAHAHCDLLVVGSGPAGLEAARVAAEAGLQVILAEQDFAIAPGLLSETGSIGDEVSADWRAARIAALEAAGSVEIMPRTTVFGLYDGGVAGMLERVTDHLSDPSHHLPRERFWMVRARRTIVATGALERTVAFGNNDRPGVMLASAAGIYANRFGVAAGRRAIVATNNDSGYQSALDLAAAGVEVAKILDVRERAPDGLVAKAKAAGIEIMTSSVPVEAAARGTIGKLQIGRRSGTTIRAGDWLDCDLVAVSGGWTPVVNLLSHRDIPAGPMRRADPGGGVGCGCLARGRLRPVGPGRGGGRRARPRQIGAGRTGAGAGRLVEPDPAPMGGPRRGPQAEKLRRPAARREDRRRASRPSRGLCLGRASETVHHAGHGDRPGQGRQCHRPRPDGGSDRQDDRRHGHDDVPPALYAGIAGGAGRAWL
jgi:NADPH-dependent 2,4-dienoyl-CoA reductase/sulfur reductase-like enzyme